MTTTESNRAREVLDTRVTPAVEVDVLLAGGAFGSAAVAPESIGALEAAAPRDGGDRFGGMGEARAVNR